MDRMTSLLVLGLILASCSGGTGPEVGDLCMAVSLPLVGTPNGPVVTDVGLELQPGEGVIVVATATDPQGSDDLRDVLQTVGVFPDVECRGTPVTIRDDLVGSGIEETFGTAVSIVDDPGLYAAIEAAVSWPVELSFVDVDGHRTEGRTFARIIR
ncbi:MAG: hypothetical protein KJO11_00335 [Gemmatimonadetes bacterium]|nr:hypothetical protein [Gemmatimonadota bacterium]NNF37582.1 hypothetical protein [Gemmatimonadota bacterium]NNK62859.1 hypothetical protein [Gemmatimonadota bacterium]